MLFLSKIKALVGLCHFIQAFAEAGLNFNLVALQFVASFGYVLQILEALWILK